MFPRSFDILLREGSWSPNDEIVGVSPKEAYFLRGMLRPGDLFYRG